MSVSEERMLILKMLQEGKITSEEASRLLEALDNSQQQAADDNTANTGRKAQDKFQDEMHKVKERLKDWKKDFKSGHTQTDFDRMVDDFALKAERMGKTLAATTFGIADKVIDFVGSFVDTNAFNIFGSYAAVDKTYEFDAFEGMDLHLEGINGQILIKKHLENKILVKTRIRCPQNNTDNIINITNDIKGVYLKINKTGSLSVAHEVFLPELKYSSLKLETTNGKIYAEDSVSETFEAMTRNAHIDLMGVNSSRITVSTKNAKINMSYVIGRDIDINTNNSVIDVKHIKAENVKAHTMNALIFVENAQNHEGSQQLNLQLKTSNSGIKVNMNDMDSRGYRVRGKTSNGSINLLIPEMMYHNINRQGIGGSFVEAESNGYEGYSQKVFINAETSNGFIEIVK